MTLRTLIVDDEPLARIGVRGLLASHADVEIIGECDNGGIALAMIEREAPDLLLLDVEMPSLSGFDIMRAMRSEGFPIVVLLTAHAEHALRAFDAGAVDYVVKPFTDDRFRRAIERARTRVQERRLSDVAERAPAGSRNNGVPVGASYLARIPVRSLHKTSYVRVQDIVWISASDYYAELHLPNSKPILVRETMHSLEERLDPAVFCRIHRSAIIRLDSVAELYTSSDDRQIVRLRDGTRVLVGRNRRRALEAALRQLA